MWDVIGAGNGLLAGLVSITAGCAVVQPWSACLIGIIGGCFYALWSHVVLHVFKVRASWENSEDKVSSH